MPAVEYTDETEMPFGKYKGITLANVPASYLLWLRDNGNTFGAMRTYLEENLDVLKKQAENEKNQYKKG